MTTTDALATALDAIAARIARRITADALTPEAIMRRDDLPRMTAADRDAMLALDRMIDPTAPDSDRIPMLADLIRSHR